MTRLQYTSQSCGGRGADAIEGQFPTKPGRSLFAEREKSPQGYVVTNAACAVEQAAQGVPVIVQLGHYGIALVKQEYVFPGFVPDPFPAGHRDIRGQASVKFLGCQA
jgi:hypothetical protein